MNVETIIREGIRKFTDEVGRLRKSLADYYVQRGLYERARDVFEEGLMTVVTVRDFSVIFDCYMFEENVINDKMEKMMKRMNDEEDGQEEDYSVDVRLDSSLSVKRLGKQILHGFGLNADNDLDLRLARLEHLMNWQPELVNSILLRQNPHNAEQWHGRVKPFEGNPTKQILTFAEAVSTVDPTKAVGKLHTLWIEFARMYEKHNDVSNAGQIFQEVVHINYNPVDNFASMWCEWAEMETRHKNYKEALELPGRATTVPSMEVKQRVAADGHEPVQMKLHKSLRLWTFSVDLEESLGNLESACAFYERILDLKIATPEIIINYALLLEENKYFEDAFRVYERGIKIFKYPHVMDIWVTYLSKFVKRNGKMKLEQARELFEHAIEMQAIQFGLPHKDFITMCVKYAEREKSLGEIDRARSIYVYASHIAHVVDSPTSSEFCNKWREFF